MRTTPAVKYLIIINSGLLLLMYLLRPLHIDLINILGLHYPASKYFHVYQLVTHMFMHANIIHLLFNMYALWLFGTILEQVWGTKRFLIYYFVTGFGAAFLQTAVTWYHIHHFMTYANMFLSHPDMNHFLIFYKHYPDYFNPTGVSQLLDVWSKNPSSTAYASSVIPVINQVLQIKMNTPVVGASGAIFGLLLAFGVYFPNVDLFLFFIPIPIKAKYFVIGYGLIELYYGVAALPGDHIAHFAHLGGMLFGIILLLIWKKRGIRPPYNTY